MNGWTTEYRSCELSFIQLFSIINWKKNLVTILNRFGECFDSGWARYSFRFISSWNNINKFIINFLLIKEGLYTWTCMIHGNALMTDRKKNLAHRFYKAVMGINYLNAPLRITMNISTAAWYYCFQELRSTVLNCVAEYYESYKLILIIEGLRATMC